MTAQSPSTPLVWIVDSAFNGELNARVGVAERLGLGYEKIPRPNGDAAAYRRQLETLYRQRRTATDGQPVILLSGTGEDTIEALADFSSAFPHPLFSVFLASILPDTPNPRLFDYDLIVSPQIQGAKVLSTLGVPHRISEQRIAAAQARQGGLFPPHLGPRFALLLGGNTFYCKGFTADYAGDLGQRVAALVKEAGGSLVITNSRRTPDGALPVLFDTVADVPYRFFDWRNSGDSFYPALLGESDCVIVTGDSLSMCCEAAYTGKPLLVDLQECITETYHREILGKLIAHGAARHLATAFSPWTYEPVDTTRQVAEAILERLPEGLWRRGA